MLTILANFAKKLPLHSKNFPYSGKSIKMVAERSKTDIRFQGSFEKPLRVFEPSTVGNCRIEGGHVIFLLRNGFYWSERVIGHLENQL
jgi:hypothetical protein